MKRAMVARVRQQGRLATKRASAVRMMAMATRVADERQQQQRGRRQRQRGWQAKKGAMVRAATAMATATRATGGEEGEGNKNNGMTRVAGESGREISLTIIILEEILLS